MRETTQSIGRYEVLHKLGEGAMGVVYKARDPLIGRLLAIKTIRFDTGMTQGQYQDFTKRFLHEARISGTLTHQNIVTIYDVGQHQNSPFIAMEYLEGRSLLEELEAGRRFSSYDVVMFVSQMARGLDYAHSRNVVHRDVKPGNIMVQPDNKVKLMDFGIAKIPGTRATKSGVFLGSPSYTSPEQIVGKSVDWRADIFSLGVVAFEVCTGCLPFPGENITSILYRIVHTAPEFPERITELGYLEDRWREVFSRVLEKNSEQRFQKAEDFAEALKDCVMGKDPAHRLASQTDDLTLKGEVFLQKKVSTSETSRPEPVPEGQQTGEMMGETRIDLSQRKSPDVFREKVAVPDSAGGIDLKNRPVVPGEHLEETPTDTVVVPHFRRISVLRLLLTLLIIASLVFISVTGSLFLGFGQVMGRDLAFGLKFGSKPLLRLLERGNPDPQDVAVRHSMEVTSEPPGAAVWWNTEDTGQITPATLALTRKPHNVALLELRLAGHHPAATVFRVDQTLPHELDLELERDLPEVELITSPAGATVFLDGRELSDPTPVRLKLDREINKKIRLVKEGYQPTTCSAEEVLAAGASFSISLDRIVGPGRLLIRSPFPVQVSSGGKTLTAAESGQGRYRVRLTSGKRTLTIRNRTYFHYEKREFTIPEGGEAEHVIRATGFVSLKAIPSNCKIYIDGSYVDFSPVFDREIAAGRHRARFEWGGGEKKETRFTVEPGETVTVTETPS